ncbi:MAG: outer membrane protein assembly factor BamD [Deltaproteobacteria bacterium]|nr:outer membrane protein assembly factor BamD [Deltaproteobacteria bacterium]
MKLCSPVGRPLLIVGSLLAVISMGCAPNAEDQQVQANQFALRGMVADSQQQIDSLQEKIQRLEDRVSELEHNGSTSAGGNKLASIEQRPNKLESQTNSTQEGSASKPPAATANPAETNSEASNASETAPEAGSAESPGNGKEETPGAEAATANPAEATSEASNAPETAPEAGNAESPGTSKEETASAKAAITPPNVGSAAPASAANAPSWRAMMDQELVATHDDPGEKLYRAGLVQLKANNYSQALHHLQTLQRRYPKSSLSEPAEFFTANALYEIGKYDQAILQFNDQTMRFPKGQFASAAMLREAQAFMKINDRIDARLTLQKLLSDLPDSAEAPMAKSMMQTLAS